MSGTPIDFSSVLAYKLFGPSITLAFYVIPFFLLDAVTNGEEIGWRGYVLPRLQVKYSALLATLILAAIWILWHIPKFLPHWDTVYFAWWMGDTAAKALLLTWMYNNTRGSLLLVTLFHASFNTAAVFLPIGNTMTGNNLDLFILIVLLEICLAIVVTIIAGPAHLSRSKMKQIQE
jgi:membrane protease YdiL (CAAX protease family)